MWLFGPELLLLSRCDFRFRFVGGAASTRTNTAKHPARSQTPAATHAHWRSSTTTSAANARRCAVVLCRVLCIRVLRPNVSCLVHAKDFRSESSSSSTRSKKSSARDPRNDFERSHPFWNPFDLGPPYKYWFCCGIKRLNRLQSLSIRFRFCFYRRQVARVYRRLFDTNRDRSPSNVCIFCLLCDNS